MIRRLQPLYYAHEDFESQVASLLAETPYDPLSQVRFETAGAKPMLMHEVESRISHQLTMLDNTDELTARTRLPTHQLGDEPEIGYLDKNKIGRDMIDRAIEHLPRYQEYLKQNIVDVMKQFCITLNRSHAPACPERTGVARRLLNDIEANGISLKEFALKGLKGMTNAVYTDTVERPGAAHIMFVRGLLHGDRYHKDYPLRKFVIEETLRKLPIEDILLAARNDHELSSAYEATNNKLFLERMSNDGIAARFSEDLGL
jgi:hypothetical protein